MSVHLDIYQLLGGLALSAIIGGAGYRKGALSRSGVLGALLVGTAIFGLGGWVWGFVLIAFFVSSSLLSRYREQEKEGLAEKFAKGYQRDLGQALANGGWGAVLSMIYLLRPHPLLWAAFLGAMGTVNADTWATELGVLSPTPPRLLTTGEPVPVGTSGGVSRLGSVAAALGGGFIGLVAFLLHEGASLLQGRSLQWADLWIVVWATVGGLAGSFFDSLLGATVQGIYYCPVCRKETERAVHRCGTPTSLRRGWRWLNNDLVNFLSSVVGGLVAAGLAWIRG